MPPYNLKDTYFSLKRIISAVLGGVAELIFYLFGQLFQILQRQSLRKRKVGSQRGRFVISSALFSAAFQVRRGHWGIL